MSQPKKVVFVVVDYFVFVFVCVVVLLVVVVFVVVVHVVVIIVVVDPTNLLLKFGQNQVSKDKV